MRKSFLFFSVVFLLVTVLLENQKVSYETTVAAAPENVATIFLPVITNRHDPKFPAPLFGMQMYSSTDSNSKYHPFLIESGTSWVRNAVDWQSVEPENHTPAVYSWAQTDQRLAGARLDMGGLHMIGVIDTWPTWARLLPDASSGPIRPDALDDFADFVRATVERYDGDGFEDAPGRPVVKHWEIVNEPDGGNPVRLGPYGAEYAEMLSIAYTAVKSADPNALVLFGGIAYDWFDYQGGPFVSSFLDDVLSAGGGSYFDVMNFHMYPLFASNWDSLSTGLKGKAEAIRAKLAQYGLEKPIVVTEAGWHNSSDVEPISSDAEQAARLVQLMTQSYAIDAKVTIWFMLSDPGGFLPNYGLVTNEDDPQPKEAYTAYQTAVSMLNNARFTADLSQTDLNTGQETTELYRFTIPNGQLYIGWINPYTSTDTKLIQIPASAVTITNPWGVTTANILDDNNDGLVEVGLTNQPVYIQAYQTTNLHINQHIIR